jgi:hypothetical protein
MKTFRSMVAQSIAQLRLDKIRVKRGHQGKDIERHNKVVHSKGKENGQPVRKSEKDDRDDMKKGSL